MKLIGLFVGLFLLNQNLNAAGFIQVDMEIFKYEGEQYTYVMVREPSRAFAVGEIDLKTLSEEPKPATMFHRGEQPLKKLYVSCSFKNDRCSTLHYTLKNQKDSILFKCDLKATYHDNLFWLSGDYSCSPEMEVTITNDNT